MKYYHWILIIPGILFCSLSSAQKSVSVYYLGPDDVLLNPALIRGELGYSWADINQVDTFRNRKAEMVNVKCEFMMISAAMDKYMNFVVHDALYTDFRMGKITSEKAGENLPSGSYDKEKGAAINVKFGYDFNIGYRNKHWGLMAGIRPQWSTWSIGDFSASASPGGLGVFSLSYPLSFRAEWRPISHYEYRMVFSAWSSLIGGVEQTGFKLELPTFPRKRYSLFFEYNCIAYQFDYLSTNAVRSEKTTLIAAGIRYGSLF